MKKIFIPVFILLITGCQSGEARLKEKQCEFRNKVEDIMSNIQDGYTALIDYLQSNAPAITYSIWNKEKSKYTKADEVMNEDDICISLMYDIETHKGIISKTYNMCYIILNPEYKLKDMIFHQAFMGP